MTIIHPNELLKSGLADTNAFLEVYAQNFNGIFNLIKEFQGAKNDFYFDDILKEQNTLRFLLVFSDLVNLYPKGLRPDSGGKVRICNPNEFSQSLQISLPREVIDSLEISNGQIEIHPCLLTHQDDILRRHIDFLEPALKSNRVILHSSRIVVGKAKSNDFVNKTFMVDNQNHWISYDIKPGSPIDNWLVNENARNSDSINVSFSHKNIPNSRELLDISVPYIQNIPIPLLIKILDDNQDEVIRFRSALKRLVVEAINKGSDVEEIKNDLLEPAVSKLNLTFKRIKRQHRRKITFSVGTIGLSFIALIPDLSQLVATLGLGRGVSDMFRSEEDFQNEQERMKEDDLYFLWKIKNTIR